MTTTREKILEAALHACQKARPATYAPPHVNFPRATELIAAWMRIRAENDNWVFSEFDYVVFHVMVKLARLASNPAHFDSWVDVAGWGACGAEITGALPPEEDNMELRMARLNVREMEERVMEDRNVTRIAELEGLNDGLRCKVNELEEQLNKVTAKLAEIATAMHMADLTYRDGQIRRYDIVPFPDEEIQ